jgi:hypothetical protein
VPVSRQFDGRRRAGIGGRLSFLRGVVINTAEEREIMRARSPHLATVIAQVLNGETLALRKVEDRSPFARYTVSRDPRSDSHRVAIGAESTVQRPSAFGYGIIATTEDVSLADKVSQALNEFDPLPRARVMRGLDWW